MTITTKQLAGLYLRGTDATGFLFRAGADSGVTFVDVWRSLVREQYEVLVKQTGIAVSYVSGQPYESPGAAEKMFAAMDAGALAVSTDFNESELNGERGNLLFRAAHDLSHYLCDLAHRDEGNRCNFKLDGETRAAHRQAKHLLALSKGWASDRAERTRIVQTVFSEVILQAAVFYETGDFAAQKVILADLDSVINPWFVQNGLPALTV